MHTAARTLTSTARRPAPVRPAPRMAARPVSTPARVPLRAPQRIPSGLIAPEWVVEWAQTVPAALIDERTAHAVVAAIREGATLTETVDLSGLDLSAVLKLVGSIGSRCTQIGKTTVKVIDISASPDHVAHVCGEEGAWAVQAADGWLRSRRAGDVRRAYCAILVSHPDTLTAAIARTLDVEAVDVKVSYTHYADLFGAARKALPPLHLVVSSPAAAAGYLDAWQHLDATVTAAREAVTTILAGAPVADIPALAAQSFWLLPNVQVLARWARVAATSEDGHVRLHAERQIANLVANLRHVAARTPRRLHPTRLEHLTIVQVRAIAALRRLHPSDGAHSREEHALGEFAKAARKAMAEAGIDA